MTERNAFFRMCPNCGREIPGRSGRCPHCSADAAVRAAAMQRATARRRRLSILLATVGTFVVIATVLSNVVEEVEESFPDGVSDWGASPAAGYPRGGWLCDYDRNGGVVLWSRPLGASAAGNGVADVVVVAVGDCVPVSAAGETVNEGVRYYRVHVGGKSGWVTGEYVYWERSAFR